MVGFTRLSLPPLPTMRELIRLYGLSAKKKLAQNFIMDLNLTEKIALSGGSLLNSTVIEVGPGPGSLTRSILQLGARKVIVVEKDRRFLPALEVLQQAAGKDRMEIVIGDMLEEDESELVKKFGVVDSKFLEETSEDDRWKMDSPVKIIGNLPFNVGTLLLFKWLHQLPTRKGSFVYGRTPLILLYQEEVANVRELLPLRFDLFSYSAPTSISLSCLFIRGLWPNQERRNTVACLSWFNRVVTLQRSFV
jgi:dimethyladenosine transferase 1